VGGQYYGGAEKASGGNQVKDSKSLGESLEFLRAKSELEKAIELKWKKIGWSQFERGKLMQEEFIKEFMKTVVSKGLFDPVGDWMKAITDQWTNVTEKGILCYRHNLPRIKKTSGDSETWQCVPTSANMVCDPIFEGATCAAEGAYKGKDSRAFDTLTCDAGCTDLNYKGGVAGHDDKGKGSRGRTIGEVGSGLSAEIVNNGTLVDDLERKIKAVRDGTKAVKALVDCIGNAGCDAGESAAAGTNLSPSQIADNNALKAAFNDLINRTNASANAMERVQERIKAAQSAAYDAKESAKGAVGLDRDDAKYAKTAADEALKGVGQWEKSDKPEDHKALDDAAKGAQETLDARRTQQGEAETPEGSLRYFALQVTREAQDKLRGAEQSVNDAKTALEGRDSAGAKHADVKTGYDALVALNNAQKLSATGLAIAKTLYTSEGEMYETGGRVEGKTRGLIEKRMNPVIGGLNGQAGTVATADDATHKGLALTASQPASVNAGDPPPADNATTLAVKVAQAPNQAARAPLVQPAKDKIGKGEDDGDNTAMKWIAKSSKAVEDADKALGQDPQALPQKPAAQGVKP